MVRGCSAAQCVCVYVCICVWGHTSKQKHIKSSSIHLSVIPTALSYRITESSLLLSSTYPDLVHPHTTSSSMHNCILATIYAFDQKHVNQKVLHLFFPTIRYVCYVNIKVQFFSLVFVKFYFFMISLWTL